MEEFGFVFSLAIKQEGRKKADEWNNAEVRSGKYKGKKARHTARPFALGRDVEKEYCTCVKVGSDSGSKNQLGIGSTCNLTPSLNLLKCGHRGLRACLRLDSFQLISPNLALVHWFTGCCPRPFSDRPF